jgi:arylamine N-acetyltransferase
MSSLLSDALVDALLERLGVESPGTDLEGLTTIYGAWCRAVPFDNALRRVALTKRSGAAALPGLTAEGFIRAFLEHGTGGMCVPTTQTLHTLLRTLGFESERAVASIAGAGAAAPDHVTLVARVAEADYVLDTTILSERPIPLRPHVHADPLHPIKVERASGYWRVRYLSPAQRVEERCTVLERLANGRSLVPMYRRTQQSATFARFNRSLYVRRNVDDGVLVLIGNQLFDVDGRGDVTASNVQESRVDVLTDRFGMSATLAALVPRESPQVNRELEGIASLWRDSRSPPPWMHAEGTVRQ